MFYLTTHSTHFIYGFMATLFKLLLLLLLLLSFFFFFFKTNIYLFTYMKQQMFHLTTYSTHFIYGYMASDIWLMTILIVRKETRCSHIGYSYRLTARVLLYALSHRQDNISRPLLHQSWK